uniref:Uncharacterized protein n=1 Tax=Arundo donax TaxID=35708 RepID=A0A0A9EJ06_ARUDO
MPYCWFLPRTGCKRWLPLAVGDVEQEGISSVSTECVAPVVIKGLPAAEMALSDVVGGKAACDVSANPACFCGSFCCDSCCMGGGGGGVACDGTLVLC